MCRAEGGPALPQLLEFLETKPLGPLAVSAPMKLGLRLGLLTCSPGPSSEGVRALR